MRALPSQDVLVVGVLRRAPGGDEDRCAILPASRSPRSRARRHRAGDLRTRQERLAHLNRSVRPRTRTAAWPECQTRAVCISRIDDPGHELAFVRSREGHCQRDCRCGSPGPAAAAGPARRARRSGRAPEPAGHAGRGRQSVAPAAPAPAGAADPTRSADRLPGGRSREEPRRCAPRPPRSARPSPHPARSGVRCAQARGAAADRWVERRVALAIGERRGRDGQRHRRRVERGDRSPAATAISTTPRSQAAFETFRTQASPSPRSGGMSRRCDGGGDNFEPKCVRARSPPGRLNAGGRRDTSSYRIDLPVR